MARDNLLVGIDVGSSKVAVVVGTMNEGTLSIMGVASASHHGLRRGTVVDLEETVSAISHAIEEAERIAGMPITHAYIGINGHHIASHPATGVVAVSRPTGEITHDDVARVIEAAKTVALPQNRELLHIFPHHFAVDGEGEIRDPIGIQGIRLEVQALMVSAGSSALRNLMKAVEQAGIEIDGMVFGPLATTLALTTKKQRDSGVMLLDIGAGTTSVAVYEEGELLYCGCIPIGSTHITNDIAIGLRTNLDVAEEIKLKYGTVMSDKVRDSEMINLAVIDPAEEERVSRKQVAEIIEARVLEMFQMIRDELQRIGKDGLLPAGVIFTGGGSELEGISELARNNLRLPATIGYPTAQISGMLDKLDNPIYATGVGLVLWASEETQHKDAPWKLDLGKFGGVTSWFRGILRNFTH